MWLRVKGSPPVLGNRSVYFRECIDKTGRSQCSIHIGNIPSEFTGNYKARRLRRCMRKNTSTPAAIINIAVSTIIITFSFLPRNTAERIRCRRHFESSSSSCFGATGSSPYLLMNLFHHREQILKNLQQTRTSCHDHHRRHDKNKNRKHELYADFGGAFFRILFSPIAQKL
jgi:hypothetical protein